MIFTREDARRRILQVRAHRAVKHALRTGRLARPAQCDGCHRGIADKLDAHHANGYEPEHALDVVFLCLFCHVAAHHADGMYRRRNQAIRESHNGIGLNAAQRRALIEDVRAELRASRNVRKEAA